MNPHAPLVDQ